MPAASPQPSPRPTSRNSRAGRWICLLALTSAIGMVAALAFILWGPDADRIDRLAWNLLAFGGPGICVEKLLEGSLWWRRAMLGPQHPEVARSLRRLGRYYFSTGNTAGAESAMAQALAISTRWQQEHPSPVNERFLDKREFLSTSLDLSAVYIAEHKFSQAIPLLDSAGSAFKQGVWPLDEVNRYRAQAAVAAQKAGYSPVVSSVQVSSWQNDMDNYLSESRRFRRQVSPVLAERSAQADAIDAQLLVVDYEAQLVNYDEARRLLQQIIDFERTKGEQFDITRDLQQLATICEAAGDTKAADQAYSELLTLLQTKASQDSRADSPALLALAIARENRAHVLEARDGKHNL